jgi:hypothetical protein
MKKKKIITMSELKQINPYQYTRVLLALQRNQVKPKESKKAKPNNFKSDFTKDSIEKYIANRILNN